MALKKAKIYIMGEKIKENFDCLFNPNQYTITNEKDYTWANPIGVDQPVKQYAGSQVPVLDIELFFDTYMTPYQESQKEDVRKYTDKISKAMSIDAGLHEPPEVRIVWGSLDFKGVIVKASHTFTMFLESGKPVRAKVSLTIMATETMEEQLKKTPLESPDRTKHRRIHQSEALWMLSSQEYKDPRLWKEIAKANKIANPRLIKPGQIIKIPSID